VIAACGTSDDSQADEPDDSSEPLLDAGDCVWPEDEAVALAGALHVEGSVDYGDGAPAGGDHAPCWGAWGVHDEPLPPENFVHNLEHGGVAILYHCPEGCATALAALQRFVSGHELTVLTAYPDLDRRFALTAWGYRTGADCLSLAAVEAFYEAHVDRGPERFGRPPPDPPASCE
jgi:hypothetical protein